jgi:hypothetical protein
MTDYRNHRITKEIHGWRPPDTDELNNIVDLLDKIGKRIHSLRIAFLENAATEEGRLHRLMVSRKRAIEKAYQRGLNKRRKHRRRHA